MCIAAQVQLTAEIGRVVPCNRLQSLAATIQQIEQAGALHFHYPALDHIVLHWIALDCTLSVVDKACIAFG